MVGVPLTVLVVEKAPQMPTEPFTPPHATLHVTPALPESFATTAVYGEVALTLMNERAGGLNVTVMAPPVMMVITAEADFVLSVTDVAVTVTVFPLGIADGAV